MAPGPVLSRALPLSTVSLMELLLITLYLTSPLQEFAKAGADMYTFHIEAAAEGMESRGLEAHAQLLIGSCHGQAGNRGPPHALRVPGACPKHRGNTPGVAFRPAGQLHMGTQCCSVVSI